MLKIYTYQIPFVTPFKIAQGSYSTREGIILCYEEDGLTAYGEIAPLPGFSAFTIQNIIPILEQEYENISEWLSTNDDDFLLNFELKYPIPSLLFGLDTLVADYHAKKKNQTLQYYLNPTTTQTLVPANAAIGIQADTDSILADVSRKVEQGFDTIKLKVGLNFEHEFQAIQAIRTSYKDVKLRLDANRSWGYNDASKYLNLLTPYDIEYIEEPLLLKDRHLWGRLKQASEIKIAADESFRNKKDALELIDQNLVDLLILKPMMFGRFSEMGVTIELANSHDIDIVFTTSLESVVGRTATAVLSSIWGSKKYNHGISTGTLLEDDLADTVHEMEGDRFKLPNQNGLGILINTEKLNLVIG